MLKKMFIAMLVLLPMAAIAQNTWEMPEETPDGKVYNPDQKYLAGAVPVENDKVVFSTTINAPGKSAAEIYDILLAQMTKMVKEKNQFEQSRIGVAEKDKVSICGYYQEWLVFKDKALVLDRTRLMYNLMVNCQDGKAEVKMTRIYYLYDEERQPTTYKAEEWITDEYGLKKNGKKLSRISGKFRRKTIDRKDYIFNKFNSLLNK